MPEKTKQSDIDTSYTVPFQYHEKEDENKQKDRVAITSQGDDLVNGLLVNKAPKKEKDDSSYIPTYRPGEEPKTENMHTSRNILIPGIILLFVVISFFVYKSTHTIDTSSWDTYVSDSYGLSFKYPAYYLTAVKNISGTQDGAIQTVILVKNTQENKTWIDAGASGVPAPLSISCTIFNNPSNLSPYAWATSNTSSNFSLNTSNNSRKDVAGQEAVSYSWTGLYQSQSVVLSNGAMIIMCSGGYLDPHDEIFTDYKAIIQTIKV